MKVRFLDKRVFTIFLQITSAASAGLSTLLLFVNVPEGCKTPALIAFMLALSGTYLGVWAWSNRLNHVEINIEGTSVTVKVGDIFLQPGLKAIAFNEYFDTKVDNEIISENSLNGAFLKAYLKLPIGDFDKMIEQHRFEDDEVMGENSERLLGKKVKYRLGTIFVHKDFLLTAMSKFDDSNRATLTMPEYLEFLIRFWDRVNKVYAQKSVSAPIFGSGESRLGFDLIRRVLRFSGGWILGRGSPFWSPFPAWTSSSPPSITSPIPGPTTRVTTFANCWS